MRAVLNTVVFLRALINPHGVWGRLLFNLSDRYTILLSPAIIGEIVDVLYRPDLRQRFPQIAEPPALEAVLALFARAEVVEPSSEPRVCRDADDDKFFACAIKGRAAYIVSEDKDVLTVGEHEGVRTVSAAEFIEILEGPMVGP